MFYSIYFQDGGWSPWTSWTPCQSQFPYNCEALGNRTRFRTCTDPVPMHDGLECQGPHRDEGQCMDEQCQLAVVVSRGKDGAVGLYNVSPETKKLTKCEADYPLPGTNPGGLTFLFKDRLHYCAGEVANGVYIVCR